MGTDVVGTGLPWIEAIAESFEPHDFLTFHRTELPAFSARNGHLVVADLRRRAAARVLHRRRHRLHLAPVRRAAAGGRKATPAPRRSWSCREQTFSDFVNELLTASGAVRTGRARVVRGALTGLAAVGAGDPVTVLGPRDLRTAPCGRRWWIAHGDPLDLHRAFTVDDDEDEMRHFLDRRRATSTSRRVHRRRGGALRDRGRARSFARPAGRSVLLVVGQRGRRRGRHADQLPRSALVGCSRSSAHDPRLLRFARLAGPTCACATTASTDRWCSSRTPTS